MAKGCFGVISKLGLFPWGRMRAIGVVMGLNSGGVGALPRRSSRFARNIFFHQRAAIVVGAGMQAELRETAIKLYPGDLNIVDRAGKHQARECMNLEMLSQSWTRPRKSLVKQDVVLVNKSEGNEFRESASLVLDLAQA